MTSYDAVNPPRWFRYLLYLALAGRVTRDCFVGDLIEERNEIVRRGDKLGNKSLWYAGQLFAVISHRRLTIALTVVVCATILLSNGLLPVLGVNIPEFPGTNVIFFGGIALAWSYAGFIAYRRTGNFADGSLAGATSALFTMTAAMLTFALLEWDHEHLAAFELLPLFVLVGVVFGSLGSLLGRFVAPVNPSPR